MVKTVFLLNTNGCIGSKVGLRLLIGSMQLCLQCRKSFSWLLLPSQKRGPCSHSCLMNLGDELEQHHLNIYDKCGMAAGVEMRAPYLDTGVVKLISQLPLRYLVRRDIGINKYILRHLCLRRFGYDVTDIVLREKRGLPSAGWRLRQRFSNLCDEVLPDDYLTRHELGPYFETKRGPLMFELFHE